MVNLNFGSFLGNKTLKIMIFNPKISQKNVKKRKEKRENQWFEEGEGGKKIKG